jgi:hypothetical protein
VECADERLAAVLGEPGDDGCAGEVARCMTAHAVGDGEHGRLREEAVFIDLAAEPGVGQRRPGECDLGAVGKGDPMAGIAIAYLRHLFGLLSAGVNRSEFRRRGGSR